MSAGQENRAVKIYEMANAFAQRLDLDDLIPFALERCRELLGADGVSILLIDPEKRELYFPYVSESDPEAARKLFEARIPLDCGIAGAVLKSRRGELVLDAHRDPRFFSQVDDKTRTITGSLIAMPLLNKDDTPQGVIEAVRRVGEPAFTTDDMTLLEQLAGSVAIALENAQQFKRIRESEDRLRIEVGALRRELARNDRFAEIIAVSPAMSEVFRRAEAAAASIKSVLIQGETGTGKELVARAIHRISTRADRPFVAINCAAVPEGLLESELFGHRRGAFSGALEDQVGLFRAANGGVLFLDEIGEMPIQMQAKLLRVLQEGEVKPVGDTRSHKVDVRIISATNRDLEIDVHERKFRSDLFYRLNAFTIRIPPLRERREDIPLIASRLLEAAARAHGKTIQGLTAEAVQLIQAAEWPGNVRQLQNEIEQAVALAREGETLAPAHFSRELVTGPGHPISSEPSAGAQARSDAEARPGPSPTFGASLNDARARFEASFIADMLARFNGNVSRTAVALGVSRVTLQKKMKEYA